MTYSNVFSGIPISDGWAAHRSRGSLGGIDFVVGVGTPIKAPTNGRLQNIPYNGTGGHTATFWHGDGGLGSGWRDQFMHLSRFVGEGNYNAGDIIGYTGGAAGSDGSGSSTGPHCHWHLVNSTGTRVNPENYWGQGGGVAPSNVNGSISELAAAVIRGDYGNGDQRKAALGSRYDEVQAEVNRILNGGGSAPAPSGGRQHVVVPGDTLWDISETYLGDGSRYMEIYNISSFRSGNPSLIYPGEIAVIP